MGGRQATSPQSPRFPSIQKYYIDKDKRIDANR